MKKNKNPPVSTELQFPFLEEDIKLTEEDFDILTLSIQNLGRIKFKIKKYGKTKT